MGWSFKVLECQLGSLLISYLMVCWSVIASFSEPFWTGQDMNLNNYYYLYRLKANIETCKIKWECILINPSTKRALQVNPDAQKMDFISMSQK